MAQREQHGRGHTRRRRTRFVLSVVLLAGAAAGCGDGNRNGEDGGPTGSATVVSDPVTTGDTGITTSEGTDSGTSATGGPTATTGTGGTDGTAAPAPSVTLVSDPVAVDPAWEVYEEAWYVWGVEAGDVLNARSDAGASQRLVTTFAPDATGLTLFTEGKLVGDEAWRPVVVPGGAAWVNARYLRPVGPATPEVRGTPEPAVADAAAAVADALRTVDLVALAALTDPDGVRVSPHAFVADDAVRLTPAQIAGATADDTELLWGYTDGEGAPIRRTVLAQLRVVGGSTALTSTSTIGHGSRLGTSNSADNIDTAFPGAARVEYHFAGTSLFGDYDWTTVRLVFDASGPSPTLVGIVEDTWTI